MAQFFIDPTNGSDANAGTSTGAAWQTLAKYTTIEVRSAGDIATCRNGLSDNLGAADLAFDEDGTVDDPIVIEADYANAFSDDVDLSVTATATLVFGSKAVLFSAAITGVIAVGDVIYAASDAAKDFSYEVAASQASDSGTDDGADSNKLIDTGKFANTVLGTQVINTTDSITGYVSVLTANDEVEVTLDGRPVANGGTVVVFDNGDTWTIADQAVLFLPYKGAQAGSGKTMTNIQSPPLWNTPSGDFQWLPNTDNWWEIKGIHIRGTDANANVIMVAVVGWGFNDCIFEGNGSGDIGLLVNGSGTRSIIKKCRFFNHTENLRVNNNNPMNLDIRDCLFDGNSVSSSKGLRIQTIVMGTVIDSEFRNHATGDVENFTTSRGGELRFRNVLMLSATQIDSHDFAILSEASYLLEDFDQEIGDTRQLTYLSSVEGTPIIQSDTGTVRSGGNNISIKVTPSTKLSTASAFSRQLLFEVALYATTSSKKYEVFFRPDATANWTADPLATELWIELEYWGDSLFNHRRILKSTGVIDMNGSTTFTALDVTVAPAQAGVVYLRGYYAKTKESGKTNVFFCDPLPVVT